MSQVEQYIYKSLGQDVHVRPMHKNDLHGLPFYVRDSYRFDEVFMFNKNIILAEAKAENEMTTGQIEKQIELIRDVLGKRVVLVADEISAIERKRLIQKGVNFIVPGRQMYLPDLLIEINEYDITDRRRKKKKRKNLTPSAQCILLYAILSRNGQTNEYSFKDWAAKLNYSQMAITKAVEILQEHELCTVTGTKEKYIQLNKDIRQLWQRAERLMTTPVMKTVYTDELPYGLHLHCSNTTALPDYTEIAHSGQEYRAIEKSLFNTLKKNNQWENLNEYEGRYCLEVWKYNPMELAEVAGRGQSVDPLSLYLSLRQTNDERIEMALEQIKERYLW